MAGWLHGVFVGEWLFVFPLCGFSLSLFFNYFRFRPHAGFQDVVSTPWHLLPPRTPRHERRHRICNAVRSRSQPPLSLTMKFPAIALNLRAGASICMAMGAELGEIQGRLCQHVL